MSAPSSEDTALGTARGRFIASLPRKAVELRGAIALLMSTPAAIAPRDEMRRRLQTLYASALVFRDQALADLVKSGIERIDVAQQQGRGLTMYDLKVLGGIISKLPTLHQTERGVAVLTAALRDEPPPVSAPDPEAVEAALRAPLPEALDEADEQLPGQSPTPAELQPAFDDSVLTALPTQSQPQEDSLLADLRGRHQSIDPTAAYSGPGGPPFASEAGGAAQPSAPESGPESASTREASPSRGVAIGGVNVVTQTVPKRTIREEYDPRVIQTLSGLAPVEMSPESRQDEAAVARSAEADEPDGRVETDRGLAPVILPPAASDSQEALPERPTVARTDEPALPERPTVVAPDVSEDAAASLRDGSQPESGHLHLGASPIRDARTPSEPAGAPLLQRVVQVLLLETGEHAAQLRSQLPTTSLELKVADSAERALQRARSEGPDVVVASRELAMQGDFIRRLRSDPLTDFVPVVLLQGSVDPLDPVAARELGADEVLTWPVSPARLAECVGRVTGTLVDEGNALAALSDATLAEVADRVADEIRHGLVDAAEAGLDLRVPLGGGAEVLAAAWAAVARVRAFVSQQSGGRIRFRDVPTRGGPALLALVGGGQALTAPADGTSLQDRCVLVVDDDPSVVWFFAGLLREEGAHVLEASDGREALGLARKRRPDVVISDILMPEMDGFALCRELKRDPLLADVPVILLSWKEDLLHRMRELQVGASGYLRKEAAAAQILSRIREVLSSRAALESALAAGGEVRGNLEGIGLVAMLRSVARSRPNSRVTIRDAWNVFELELRQGHLRALTRTASDGTLVRGEPALPQLLGSSTGRFTVTDTDLDLTLNVEGELDQSLLRGAQRLGAMIDAVSGGGLLRARRVQFDEDAYALVQKQSPGPVRDLVERLHAGEAPSDVLLTGDTSAHTLEAVLIDLARRGAIRAVTDGHGNDLIAAALQARGGQPMAQDPDAAVTQPRPAQSGAHAAAPASTEAVPPAQGVQARAPNPDDFDDEVSREHVVADLLGRGAAAKSLKDAPAMEASRPVPSDPRPRSTRKVARTQKVDQSADAGIGWGWVLGFALLVVVGFFAVRWFEAGEAPISFEQQQQADQRLDELAKSQPEVDQPATLEPPVAQDVLPDDDLTPLPPAEGTVVPQDVGFQIYEGITDSTIDVAEDQGLLIMGARAGGATDLRVDGKEAGSLPLKLPLSEGIHELELRRGDNLRFLFVAVAPGKTWVLAEP